MIGFVVCPGQLVHNHINSKPPHLGWFFRLNSVLFSTWMILQEIKVPPLPTCDQIKEHELGFSILTEIILIYGELYQTSDIEKLISFNLNIWKNFRMKASDCSCSFKVIR